jgi:hypothetical protein
VDSQDFVMHILDEVFSQDMVHIDDLPLLGDAQVALGILFSCVTSRPSYLTWIVPPSFLPSYLFWQILTKELCRYMGTS